MVHDPKTSKSVYKDNLKSQLMMAKPKNLKILCHKQGSQSHKEI